MPRFGKGVELAQPITLDEPVRRVELLLTTADGTPPLVIEVPPPTGIGPQTLRHTVDVGGDGHILPNTPISAALATDTAGARCAAGDRPRGQDRLRGRSFSVEDRERQDRARALVRGRRRLRGPRAQDRRRGHPGDR
ncbi:MAG: hypothetical protein WKF78_14525 [Candidatus Limnocylindrales bacterium]